MLNGYQKKQKCLNTFEARRHAKVRNKRKRILYGEKMFKKKFADFKQNSERFKVKLTTS